MNKEIKTIDMDLTVSEGRAVLSYLAKLKLSELPSNKAAVGLHKVYRKLDETIREIDNG